MSRTLRLAYIMGTSHSGSTLLDLLISSHSKVVSVGEGKSLTRAPTVRCTCGVKPGIECPFWRRVDAAFRGMTGDALAGIALESEDDEVFHRHNLGLYEAVRDVTDRDIVVDSSKDLRRLERLLRLDGITVLPIHIVRDALGVVASEVRKGRSWRDGAQRYIDVVRATRRLLDRRDHVSVRYEELVERPEAVVGSVMQRLGLEFEPQQLDWARRERHNLGGNHVRRSESSRIRLDTSWKKRLSVGQRLAVRWMMLRARL